MDHSIIRISKEIASLQKQRNLCEQLPECVLACKDADVRNIRALIFGPHETPYEFGFFEFSVKFPKDYPSTAPAVTSTTTNNGRCRFNPNIYANGKVCLSILGTWRGEPGEEWSSAQGLESIMLSIQSLMSSNPYENEPGYERHPSSDKEAQKQYAQKIQHETIRISICSPLERILHISPEGKVVPPPSATTSAEDKLDEDIDESPAPFEPFADLFKRRFLWYYESYMNTVERGMGEVTENQPFARMPFEQPGNNSMDGEFNYPELKRKLQTIKAAIEAELLVWEEQGREAAANETTVAFNLRNQYHQAVATFKKSDMPLDICLVNENPFVWMITYFGRPMTNLDGGIIRIRFNFSPRFPEELPRVTFLSKIFHHHITPDGTACYHPDPTKIEDVKSHIHAIFNLLEEEDPAYDPRETVNPEASKLFWSGDTASKKMYSRRLRRSVQQSME